MKIFHFPNRGNDFAGSKISHSFVNAMCGTNSLNVVQDRHRSSFSTGTTFARAMGFLFDMHYDNS